MQNNIKIVGVNGFGRIGRYFTRLSLNNPQIDVAVINDLSDINTLAHLLKYDSIHGRLGLNFEVEENSLIFDNGKKLLFIQEKDPSNIHWDKYNIEYVIESTGLFLTQEKASKHFDLNPNLKKVILSAPANDDETKTVVLGVNEDLLVDSDKIISNASCTTNSAAPMIEVIRKLTHIESAYITTIHSFTTDQRLHDSPHKDLRRARAASMSIVPTSTGAAKALTKIYPELENHFGGCGMRVPVPDGSLTDLTLIVSDPPSVEEINAAFKLASESYLKNILSYTEDPIVSVDIIGNSSSVIFDSDLTSVIGNMIKLVGWYDNEAGYSNRLINLIELF
jgi:glyceraldehyde 3-phosphate dehydrogenase